MAKQVVHGEESRAAILRGVNQLADEPFGSAAKQRVR